MSQALARIEKSSWLCSICPEPGACCRRFCLPSHDEDPVIPETFWKDSMFEDGQKVLTDAGLPFKVGGIEEEIQSKEGALVTLWYYCPKVTSEGRCFIYENRPECCSSYQPMTDNLCVFWRPDVPRELPST